MVNHKQQQSGAYPPRRLTRPRAGTAVALRSGFAVAAFWAVSVPAFAQTTVYETEDISLDVAVDAQSVVFTQDNSWFGEPVANIGVDTDSWAEVAVEPHST